MNQKENGRNDVSSRCRTLCWAAGWSCLTCRETRLLHGRQETVTRGLRTNVAFGPTRSLSNSRKSPWQDAAGFPKGAEHGFRSSMFPGCIFPRNLNKKENEPRGTDNRVLVRDSLFAPLTCHRGENLISNRHLSSLRRHPKTLTSSSHRQHRRHRQEAEQSLGGLPCFQGKPAPVRAGWAVSVTRQVSLGSVTPPPAGASGLRRAPSHTVAGKGSAPHPVGPVHARVGQTPLRF